MNIRSLEQEKLDNLHLHGESLNKALKSLAWVNKWLGNHNAVIRSLLSIHKRTNEPVSIIDLGCGGGDTILALAKQLRKNKIAFFITGIDGNKNSLQFAQTSCAGFNEIKFMQADILSDDFEISPCDILISSHFMYHFTEDGFLRFLNKYLPFVSTGIICSELERSRFAIFVFSFTRFILPISRMAKQDGLLALKRSFTKKEWFSILDNTTIKTFKLRSVPVFRVLLIIYPDILK